MADTLEIFGTEYTNVAGIVATNNQSTDLTYIRPQGTKSITQNGIGIDVSEYASVDVSVSGGQPMLQTKTYTVSSAGAYAVMADSGYDGLQEVDVIVPSASIWTEAASMGFVTESGVRKWRVQARTVVDPGEGDIEGWIAAGDYDGNMQSYNAVPSNTTITPTESAQTIGGANTMMEGAVTVNPIPSDYVNLPKFTVDLTANPATATCNKTYAECVSLYTNDYKANATADVTTQGGVLHVATSAVEYQLNAYLRFTVYTERGVPAIDLMYYPNESVAVVNPSTLIVEAGTPTAAKGTVSNHQVSITPSVTNTTGYITGSTKTGTAVTVSASELVSGTYTVSASGTHDVTNYASASVASGSATASATKGTVSNHSVTVTPSVTRTAGYITAGSANGTAVTVSASELVSGDLAITQNGNSIDCANYSTVSVNVSSGSSKNTQVVQGTTRTNASTLTAIGAELTVSKTGTYDIYYSCFRTNTSSSYTWATRLYINGVAYGTAENTTWTNNQQNTHLSNISLTANDKLRVYGRNTRGTSYYICAPTLMIVEA